MTRDQLLKPKTITIDLPDGGKLNARKLKQSELEAVVRDMQAAKEDSEKMFNRTCDLIAVHVLADDGSPMFSDASQVGDMDPADIRAVFAKLVGAAPAGNASAPQS